MVITTVWFLIYPEFLAGGPFWFFESNEHTEEGEMEDSV